MGDHEVQFNAGDLASGIYFYKITVNPSDNTKQYVNVKKMILVK
jgi:hypothetical protein